MQLDTHVVMWLHSGDLDRLTDRARDLIDSAATLISPMVELELDLLHEIGRAAAPAATVVSTLAASIGLVVSQTPFASVVRAASPLSWTRDPFDRLICAQAIADDALLITRDRLIRRNLDRAVWDDSSTAGGASDA